MGIEVAQWYVVSWRHLDNGPNAQPRVTSC